MFNEILSIIKNASCKSFEDISESLEDYNFIADFLNISRKTLDNSLKAQVMTITERGELEKNFWLEEIKRIKNFSRKQAIDELIKSLKIHEKLIQIKAFIESIKQ